MDLSVFVAHLERTPAVLDAMLQGLSEEDFGWRPPDGGWSLHEIACHLAAEEEDDFRTRLRLTLEDPAASWPGIDPEKKVEETSRTGSGTRAVLDRFRREREASLAWLAGLGTTDWSQAHEEPGFPTLRAGDLLAAWAAHDARHVEQVAKRLLQITARDAGTYSVAYAG